MDRQRRRTGAQKSRRQARAAPPEMVPWPFDRTGYARAALLAAVVNTVRVAVAGLVPVIWIGLVEPKLKVGGF
jgi:hypothetical protein